MEELKDRVKNLLTRLNLEEKAKQIRNLEAESTRPSFWQDHETAASKMKELSTLQKEVENAEEIQELILDGNYKEAEKLLNRLEVLLYLSNSYDENNAIVSIHAGQGGVEAMDFVQMLYRMYTRYFERKEWKAEIIEETPGEEAGIKRLQSFSRFRG